MFIYAAHLTVKIMGSEKLNAASQSIKVNAGLIVLKLGTGIYTGSLGVLAEFVHSFFDLIASIFAYLGIKQASKPADIHHQYGHGRIENISSLFQSSLIALTSLFIIYEAYRKITKETYAIKEGWIGILVMVITIIVDIKISQYLHKKSTKTGSPALEADAYHFTTDLWSTSAVIIGLGATYFGFPLGDAISAIFVALLMLALSIKLGIKALNVMLDKAPDNTSLEIITTTIANYPSLKGYHSLRAREAGSYILVDVSIHLDDSIPLKTAHGIADALEKEVIKNCPKVKEVVVHIESSTH